MRFPLFRVQMFNDLFQDYQTYLDLKKLEERLGVVNWTTSDHWAQVATKYGNPR